MSADDYRIVERQTTTGAVFDDLTIERVVGDLYTSSSLLLQFTPLPDGLVPHDVDLHELTESGEEERRVFLESDFPPSEGRTAFDFDVRAPTDRTDLRLSADDDSGSLTEELTFGVERI
jgi:hypothetical protein